MESRTKSKISQKNQGLIYIDYLEPPIAKRYKTDEIFKLIEEIFGKKVAKELRQEFQLFRTKKRSGKDLFYQFTDNSNLGLLYGYQYLWSLAVSLNDRQLHETLRAGIRKMRFKHEDAILQDIQRYSDYFFQASTYLQPYLFKQKDKIEEFEENRLNQLVSNFYAEKKSDILSGIGLNRFINSESMKSLRELYFRGEQSMLEIFVKN